MECSTKVKMEYTITGHALGADGWKKNQNGIKEDLIKYTKEYGADAILIILSAVTEDMANQIYEEALNLDMSVIVEVHTKEEAVKSLKFTESLIGINNRNLKTLETNVNTTYDIHDILINHSGPLISESGIKTKEELLEITKKTKIKTFLIGESLLKSMDKNSIFSVLWLNKPLF